ncbi:MAG: hypothetical protein M0C28_31155 [Candidatus Moduliflexus flocculans]|nr:hypothetical protein [Candidatus Moduliflexus flocculans]
MARAIVRCWPGRAKAESKMIGRRKPVIQDGPAGEILSGSPGAGFWPGLPVRCVRRQPPVGKPIEPGVSAVGPAANWQSRP